MSIFYCDKIQFKNRLQERINKIGPIVYGKSDFEGMNVATGDGDGDDYTISIDSPFSFSRNFYEFHRDNRYKVYPNFFSKIKKMLPELPNISSSTEIIPSARHLGSPLFDYSGSPLLYIDRINRNFVYKPGNEQIRELIDVAFQMFAITQLIEDIHGNTKHLPKFNMDSIFTIMLHAISIPMDNYHSAWRVPEKESKVLEGKDGRYEFRVGNGDYKHESTGSDVVEYEGRSIAVLRALDIKGESYNRTKFEAIRPGNGINLYEKAEDRGLIFTFVYILCNMINAQSEGIPIMENK